MKDDMQDVRDEAMERRMDAALGEVLGGERALDVTARVLARAAAGERIAAGEVAAERAEAGSLRQRPRTASVPMPRRWFAAAVLFGVAVVGGVAWLQRFGAEPSGHDVGPAPAPLQEPVAPEAHRQIRSVAEIAKLPRTVTHVEFRNLGDRAALALRECPWVEHVEFLRDDDDPLTSVGIAAVCALPRLRTLAVAEGNGIPADALRALGTARGLQAVRLLSDAVDDAVLVALATLPALRELELVGCRSFGEVGMRALASMRGLQALDLRGCSQLTTEQLALVGELRALQRLRLAGLPNLRDAAVMPLQNLVDLEDLDLADGRFTSKAMQALEPMVRLRRLILADCKELVGSALLHVPVGVEELDLTHCPLDRGAGPLLTQRFPKLRRLCLWGAGWLDDESFAALLRLPLLEHLKVGDCGGMTPVHLDALRAAKRLVDFDATRSSCVTDQQAAELVASRPEMKVTRKVW
ncbi:MAG: hypothetical protein JNL12_23360 [Planctomycetes bacterium]|nr:hypothetical protein [Planctomycetota bacterium]